MEFKPRLAARRAALPSLVAVACLLAAPALAAASSQGSAEDHRSVLIAFIPGSTSTVSGLPFTGQPANGSPFERLTAQPGMAIGLSSAVQGRYNGVQALLDISQGTRVSLSTYDPQKPNPVVLVPDRRGGYFQGWMEINERADSAPANIQPGLLAQSIPGGSAYASVTGEGQLDPIAAADRAGRIERVSVGSASSLAARAQALLARKALVVVSLPSGAAGDVALGRMVRARSRNELLIVMRSPPTKRFAQLLPIGIAGLGDGGTLTSSTTHLDGVVAGIDLLPTVLDWLKIDVPEAVSGQPITVLPIDDAASVLSLKGRLQVVGERRFPALWSLLGAWVVLLLCAMLAADRRGMRWAMRTGALAVFWLPSMLLLTAALAPSMTVEVLIIVVGSFLLGGLTDRFVGWPRGPALPAAVAIAAYLVDLAFGSPLVIRSLLGPNPLFGSRFYGIGNELEATLPAIALIGLGAFWYGREQSSRAAAIFAGCGLVLAAAIGSARLGADVGGVMTVAAGFAVASLLMLAGRPAPKTIVLAVLAPLGALALLAAVDLLSGGDSHFTRTVLQADGSGAWWEIFTRRFELAGRGLIRGLMPLATLVALLAIALGLLRRDRLLAPVDGDSGWRAGLAGAAAVGFFGALFNDSGPMLLLFATFIAICGVVYLRGDPRLADGAPR